MDNLSSYEDALRQTFHQNCSVSLSWLTKTQLSSHKCLIVNIEQETAEETQRAMLVFYPALEPLKEPEFTSFPLLLTQGRANLITPAVQWFTKEFDFHT